MSGSALRVFDTKVVAQVKALFAPTDPVAVSRALPLHLLVREAEVAAVQTPGQVVPQLGEVVLFARLTLCGRAGCAVRGHVRAGWTHGTGEGLSGDRVLALIGGN